MCASIRPGRSVQPGLDRTGMFSGDGTVPEPTCSTLPFFTRTKPSSMNSWPVKIKTSVSMNESGGGLHVAADMVVVYSLLEIQHETSQRTRV